MVCLLERRCLTILANFTIANGKHDISPFGWGAREPSQPTDDSDFESNAMIVEAMIRHHDLRFERPVGAPLKAGYECARLIVAIISRRGNDKDSAPREPG